MVLIVILQIPEAFLYCPYSHFKKIFFLFIIFSPRPAISFGPTGALLLYCSILSPTSNITCPVSHSPQASVKREKNSFILNLLWLVITPKCQLSVQFSHSVMSDSVRPHESQHARPPCPSPTPGVHSDSRPSSQ